MKTDLKREKQELRKQIKKKISELSIAYCKSADEKIRKHALALPEYKNAEVVFCYVGTKDEINTTPMLQEILESGRKLGVPKCISKGVMKVYAITSLDDLEEGAYGIMEPKNYCEEIPPQKIDLAFVPCVTCNKKGDRLGYGGGFYDRYLSQTDARRVILCREKILLSEIPTEEHDLRMEVVVSEEEIVRYQTEN